MIKYMNIVGAKARRAFEKKVNTIIKNKVLSKYAELLGKEKKLILKHENQVLKKELDNATEEIKQKSLKKDYLEKGIKDNNDILDDDLTIIGIGK